MEINGHRARSGDQMNSSNVFVDSWSRMLTVFSPNRRERKTLDTCPSDEELAAWFDRRLPRKQADDITFHVSHCDGCYPLWSGLVDVIDVLVDSPNERPRRRRIHISWPPVRSWFADRAARRPFAVAVPLFAIAVVLVSSVYVLREPSLEVSIHRGMETLAAHSYPPNPDNWVWTGARMNGVTSSQWPFNEEQAAAGLATNEFAAGAHRALSRLAPDTPRWRLIKDDLSSSITECETAASCTNSQDSATIGQWAVLLYAACMIEQEGLTANDGRSRDSLLYEQRSLTNRLIRKIRRVPSDRALLPALIAYQRDAFQGQPTHCDAEEKLLSAGLTVSRYQGQDRYTKSLLRKAWLQRKEVLGQSHEETLKSLNDLAEFYSRQGRYTDAEPLLLSLLTHRRATLGESDQRTITSLNDLAGLYSRLGRFSEAEPLLKMALSQRRRALGKNNPDTLVSLNNLAALYWRQGRYAEAETMYYATFSRRRELLGEHHPDTLASANNLEVLYWRQGRRYEVRTNAKPSN